MGEDLRSIDIGSEVVVKRRAAVQAGRRHAPR
jgi:hypothetical protein